MVSENKHQIYTKSVFEIRVKVYLIPCSTSLHLILALMNFLWLSFKIIDYLQ